MHPCLSQDSTSNWCISQMWKDWPIFSDSISEDGFSLEFSHLQPSSAIFFLNKSGNIPWIPISSRCILYKTIYQYQGKVGDWVVYHISTPSFTTGWPAWSASCFIGLDYNIFQTLILIHWYKMCVKYGLAWDGMDWEGT